MAIATTTNAMISSQNIIASVEFILKSGKEIVNRQMHAFIGRFAFFFTLFLLASLNSAYPKTQSKGPTCDSVIDQASSIIVQDSKGRTLVSKNTNHFFVPASTIKVLTAFVALKTLGEDYKFHTLFYIDSQKNLKVKGLGDPFITSEIMNSMAEKLANSIREVNNLVLDDTFFASNIYISGSDGTLNPYDSPVGALCVNFNTASVVSKNGVYKSGEPHTPLIPYTVNAARQFNITNGRFLIARTQEETSIYFGQLFQEFLRRHGILVKGNVIKGAVNSTDTLLLNFESPYTLSYVIKEMLKYSNNFIANQLFLVSGAKAFGAPATLEKGVAVTKRVADAYIGMGDFNIVEGSGLSRENKISASQFLKLLQVFYPYAHLLKERDSVLYKTGTLKGVSNRIGYILSQNTYYPFVIMRNGNGPSSAAVLDCLKRKLGIGVSSHRARAQLEAVKQAKVSQTPKTLQGQSKKKKTKTHKTDKTNKRPIKTEPAS